MPEFREGLFKVNNYDDAYDLAELCSKFKKYVMSPFGRPFAKAIKVIEDAKKWDQGRMIRKLERQDAKMPDLGHDKAYLSELERIYNIDNQHRETIY